MLVKSQVKYIQSLSQKKVRDAEDVFVAEGEKIVQELLHEGLVKPITIYTVTPNDSRKGENYPIEVISSHEMERISFLSSPSTMLGVFKKPTPKKVDYRQGWVLMLDGIQDPGNLGTIIRSADWFGVKQIICSELTADCFNPKVVQATMGSIARVSIIYTELKHWCQLHADLPKYAAMLDGISIKEMKTNGNGVLIIGNESKGVGESLLSESMTPITIPRIGAAESLNAAVATSIILSHLT